MTFAKHSTLFGHGLPDEATANAAKGTTKMMALRKTNWRLGQVAVAASALWLGAAPGVVLAEEGSLLPGGISLEAGVDLYGKYVWRGMLLTNDPVVQPSLTLGWKGLSLNVWGSIDTTDVNEMGAGTDGPSYRLQELDYTLSYGHTLVDGVDVEVGYILYTFPGTAYEKTSELYASLSLAIPYLNPSLTVYWDFDEADGFYANLGIEHTFELTEKLGLTVGAGLGWGDKNYHEYYLGPDTNALSDYSVGASLDYAVNDNFSISLSATHTDFVSTNIGEAAEAGYLHRRNFFVGLGFSFSF